VAGKVDPVFVDDSPTLPADARSARRRRVIAMGAGSMGGGRAGDEREGGRRMTRARWNDRGLGKVAVLMGGSPAAAAVSMSGRACSALRRRGRCQLRPASAASS
jgi:hypothetical protein